MSLPSSRRPLEVEEELRQESTKLKSIKVDLKKVFMDSMIRWYETLSPKNRGKLTGTKLKKRAIVVLYAMNYEYDRLPLDWVWKLAEATGMKLYNRKKKPKDFSFLENRGDIKDVESPTVDKDTSVGEGACALVKKPILDLTNEPPPPDWIEAYAKGEHRRRELTIVPGKDQVVMFYDYSPRYKAAGSEIVGLPQPAHDGDSFKWFAEEKGKPADSDSDDDSDSE